MAYLDEHERRAQEILAREKLKVPKAPHWERFKWYYLGLFLVILIKFFYSLIR